MFRNYLKLAFRNLRKNRLYSIIKISGLTIGITAAVLIGLYLQHELSFDTVHAKAERIARVTMEYGAKDGEREFAQTTGNKVAPTFKADFPEIEEAIRVISYKMVAKAGDKLLEEDHVYFADSSFFQVFTFPLLEGDSVKAIAEPGTVVLSASTAEKYFGDESAVGQVIKLGNKDYTVSGVMEDASELSQVQPDFVAGFMNLRDAAPERETWWNANYATYFLMRQPEDIAGLEAKIPEYMKSFYSDERYFDENDMLVYHLEPLLSVHLYSDLPGNFVPNGDIRYLYILVGIGLLILLIATTTYINLTTATGAARAREVSMQKVLGAERKHLVAQHLSEAILVTGFALTVGYGLANVLLPAFNQLFAQNLSWDLLIHPVSISAIILFGLAIGFLSGAYPAFVLSKYKVTELMMGKWKDSRGSIGIRQLLIVLQFGIAVFLIICTLVLQNQLSFIQDQKLGYNQEQVIVLPTDGRIVEKLELIKSELTRTNAVKSVSLSYETPVEIRGTYGISGTQNVNDDKSVKALPIDEDFITTMEIPLAAGANINRSDIEAEANYSYESEEEPPVRSILVNEQQAADFGWSPEEAIGQFVQFQGRRSQISGVVQDFHFSSLHESIDRLVLFPSDWGNVLLVKLSGESVGNAIDLIGEKWASFAPHRPFSYHFLDDEFAKLYASETRTAELVTTFSILAIFLACMSLFGLASFNIVKRTKEIGIRKVLGASVTGIVALLSKDFIRLVLVAIVLAGPLAYWVMNRWLQNFAYRIELGVGILVLAGLAVILIAFLAVSWQSIRAALGNPVKALRSE